LSDLGGPEHQHCARGSVSPTTGPGLRRPLSPRGDHVADPGAPRAVVYLEQLAEASRGQARLAQHVAGRSILERHLVPGLEGARRQGIHVADSRRLRSAHGSSTAKLAIARGLEAVWIGLGPRRAERASMRATTGGSVIVTMQRFAHHDGVDDAARWLDTRARRSENPWMVRAAVLAV